MDSENPKVTATTRTVELKGEALRKGGSWDRPGTNFVSYSLWQNDEAMENEKRMSLPKNLCPSNRLSVDADLVFLHGINNYGVRAFHKRQSRGLILST